MDEEELRSGLQESGLTKYEANAYLAVIKCGSAPAVQIAELADIPKSRVYDVLRNLEAEEYVETYEQDSLQVRAVDPTDVLNDLQDRAQTLSETASEIKQLWTRPSIDDHKITIVKRFDSVLEQFRDLTQSCENRIQIAATPAQLEQLSSNLREAVENNIFVKVCVITNSGPSGDLDPAQFDGIATEVRHRTLPAPFVAVVDRSHVCFAPQSQQVDRYGILVDDQTLAYVFHWYFQSALWVAWPTIFRSERNSNGLEYVNLRECISDIAPMLSDGIEVHTTVEGYDTETEERVTLSGHIKDIIFARPSTDEIIPLSTLAGRATIVLESDGIEYGVGGWGATLEDIEMTRMVVEVPEQ